MYLKLTKHCFNDINFYKGLILLVFTMNLGATAETKLEGRVLRDDITKWGFLGGPF